MSKKKVDNIEELFELVKINTEPEYLVKRYNQDNITVKYNNDNIKSSIFCKKVQFFLFFFNIK